MCNGLRSFANDAFQSTNPLYHGHEFGRVSERMKARAKRLVWSKRMSVASERKEWSRLTSAVPFASISYHFLAYWKWKWHERPILKTDLPSQDVLPASPMQIAQTKVDFPVPFGPITTLRNGPTSQRRTIGVLRLVIILDIGTCFPFPRRDLLWSSCYLLSRVPSVPTDYLVVSTISLTFTSLSLQKC